MCIFPVIPASKFSIYQLAKIKTNKIFQIILDLDAVIYVDTDVLFLSPIHELWKHFELFKVNQVLGMAKRVGWNFKVPETSYQYIKLAEREMIQVNSGVSLVCKSFDVI